MNTEHLTDQASSAWLALPLKPRARLWSSWLWACCPLSRMIWEMRRLWNTRSSSGALSSTVVATTHRNNTCDMLTSAKLLVGYLVVGITRELDKKPSLYCSSIYINYMWSMLQQCVYLMSYYSSTMCLSWGHHAIYMCPDIILLISAVHVHTMYTP